MMNCASYLFWLFCLVLGLWFWVFVCAISLAPQPLELLFPKAQDQRYLRPKTKDPNRRKNALHCTQNVARKEKGNRGDQTQNHHERIVLRKACLRCAKQRRQQAHDEGGDCVYETIDKILVSRARQLT